MEVVIAGSVVVFMSCTRSDDVQRRMRKCVMRQDACTPVSKGGGLQLIVLNPDATVAARTDRQRSGGSPVKPNTAKRLLGILASRLCRSQMILCMCVGVYCHVCLLFGLFCGDVESIATLSTARPSVLGPTKTRPALGRQSKESGLGRSGSIRVCHGILRHTRTSSTSGRTTSGI